MTALTFRLPLSLLCAYVMCACVTRAQPDSAVCIPSPPHSVYTGPQLPVLPEMWTMRVEANLVNKNTTVDVRQWHDFRGNRGAATLWMAGVNFTFLFDYPNNQQLRLEPVTNGAYMCEVSSLRNAGQPYLQGTDPALSTPTTPHIYTTASALTFAGDGSQQYLGTRRVRGMMTDAWRACVYWPQSNATMTVTWYFTVPSGWDTALGVGATPVRCEVAGSTRSPGAVHSFQHVYEVTEFYSYLDGGQAVFQTPAATVCAGRANSKPVPNLPQVFSYSAEVLTLEEQTSQFIKKAYDGGMKLAMLEFTSATSPYSRFRLIDDFNTGVSYTLDIDRGLCNVATINPEGFDAISTGNARLRMRTPYEFLFENVTDLSYEGIRNVRELNADVWVGKKSWPPNDPGPSTWEYLFLTPEWSESAGLTSASSMPVSIHVTLGDQQLSHQIYNLYDFADDDPAIWYHDITLCFEDRQFQNLTLAFAATPLQVQHVATNQRRFRSGLLQALTALVPMSPVRLNNVQLAFYRGGLAVTFTLVDKRTSSVLASPLQEATLAEVVTRILQARDLRTLVVNFDTADGNQHVSLVATATSSTTPIATTTATIIATTTATITTKTPTTTSATTKTSHVTTRGGVDLRVPRVVVCNSYTLGHTPGDMAAVSLGSALLGFILSLTSLTVWTRRHSTSLRGFKRERLEMT